MKQQRVAVAGLGAIGRALARKLDDGIPGITLTAVAARDKAKAERFLQTLRRKVPIVAIENLGDDADIVVECLPAELFVEVATPVLKNGKTLMAISVGALLSAPQLMDLARDNGGQIIVPTGALIGLDAVTAAIEGNIKSVKMLTRKPISGLKGAPYLIDNNIEIEGLTEAKLVFSGTAREAAKGFPANLNVAAALSLAGIGPDGTTIDIWADPSLKRNVHRIEVESDSACFSMTIENIPSENPKTGRITALSMVAALRKMTSPLRVGT
jgi:aspartate dehydrogenase